MTNARDNPQSISPQNAQQLYESLPIQSKATIDALASMLTALFINIAQTQAQNQSQHNESQHNE